MVFPWLLSWQVLRILLICACLFRESMFAVTEELASVNQLLATGENIFKEVKKTLPEVKSAMMC